MNPRLILAALLLTAPLLQAQDDDKKIEAQKVEITLAPAKEVAPPQKMPPPPKSHIGSPSTSKPQMEIESLRKRATRWWQQRM